jgi:hypothetical protein
MGEKPGGGGGAIEDVLPWDELILLRQETNGALKFESLLKFSMH